MRRRPTPALPSLLAVALLATFAAVSVSQGEPPADSDRDARTRRHAEGLFAIEQESGELAVEAAFVLRGFGDASQRGTLQALVDLSALAAPPQHLTLSLVAEQRDEGPLVAHQQVQVGELPAAGLWVWSRDLELPEELRDLVLVVEDEAGGAWGAAFVDLVEEPTALDAARGRRA